MKKGISRTVAIILSSMILTCSFAGCSGSGSDQQSSADSAAQSGTISTVESKADSTADAPESTTESTQPSAAEPGTEQPSVTESSASADDVVCEPSFLIGMADISAADITGAASGRSDDNSTVIFASLANGQAMLISQTPSSAGLFSAAAYGKLDTLSKTDHPQGEGTEYTVTSSRGTLRFTAVNYPDGSGKGMITIPGISTDFECEDISAEDAASQIRLLAQTYINNGSPTPEQSTTEPPAITVPAFFSELGGITADKITFSLGGETAAGSDLIYFEIDDGTPNGSAVLLITDSQFGSGSQYSVAVYGSVSAPVEGTADGRKSASATITDTSGQSADITISADQGAGLYYVTVQGIDDQFVAEAMDSDDAADILSELAMAGGAAPITPPDDIDEPFPIDTDDAGGDDFDDTDDDDFDFE